MERARVHEVDDALAHVSSEARRMGVVHTHVLVHVEAGQPIPRDVVARGQLVQEREL